MRLIVGLGNPGREYAGSRHNVGFLCVDRLAKKYDVTFNRRRSKYKSGPGIINSLDVCLVKPMTYMNNSGEAVQVILNSFNSTLGELLIIHDDMDITLGKIKIKEGGSSGGHKGVQSIISTINSDEFIRIRIGIGRPAMDTDPVSYVLGKFREEELSLIESSITRSIEAVEDILKYSSQSAMSKHNA